MKNNQLTLFYWSVHKSQHTHLMQDLVKTCDSRPSKNVCRSHKRVSTKTVNEDKKEISEGNVVSGKSRRTSEIRRVGKVRTRDIFEVVWVHFIRVHLREKKIGERASGVRAECMCGECRVAGSKSIK